MRHLFTASVVLLLLTSIARADPSTQPSCDVFVTPFTSLGGDNSLDWAGKAVSQNLLTDLAQGKFHPMEADKAFPTTADAQAAAKAAGAKFLITGTYQTLQLQVRFNGQIVDVASGNVVGGLSATGSPRDLFALEDSLSAQAIAQLTPSINPQPAVAQAANAKNKPAAAAAAAPAAAAPAAPAVIVQIVQPPAAANQGTYQGSALAEYVNSDRNPSTDYPQQTPDSYDTAAAYNFGNSGYSGTAPGGSGGAGYWGGGYGGGYAGGYGIGYGFDLVYSVTSGGTRPGQNFGNHSEHDKNHDHVQR
jgi:TolB-like protein